MERREERRGRGKKAKEHDMRVNQDRQGDTSSPVHSVNTAHPKLAPVNWGPSKQDKL